MIKKYWWLFLLLAIVLIMIPRVIFGYYLMILHIKPGEQITDSRIAFFGNYISFFGATLIAGIGLFINRYQVLKLKPTLIFKTLDISSNNLNTKNKQTLYHDENEEARNPVLAIELCELLIGKNVIDKFCIDEIAFLIKDKAFMFQRGRGDRTADKYFKIVRKYDNGINLTFNIELSYMEISDFAKNIIKIVSDAKITHTMDYEMKIDLYVYTVAERKYNYKLEIYGQFDIESSRWINSQVY